MKGLDLFVSKYPPDPDLRKPAAELLPQFQGRVPAELLAFWQEYGFGNYGGGLLKLINPMDYSDNSGCRGQDEEDLQRAQKERTVSRRMTKG